MKGIIFTEFLEMVEEEFSPEMADQIIISSDLNSEGAYTALGNYSHEELLQLVSHLSEQASLPVNDLVKAFGRRLIDRFANSHLEFFTQADSAFSFLENVDKNVHIEVKKLYPEADPPSFEYNQPESGSLIMMYRSKRPFSDLAEGLIAGVIDYFGENISVKRQDLDVEQGTVTQFTLTQEKYHE